MLGVTAKRAAAQDHRQQALTITGSAKADDDASQASHIGGRVYQMENELHDVWQKMPDNKRRTTAEP